MAPKKKSKWPPSGWKVEIKVSSNGHHYKCYINTKTGEKVSSKLAVLRCIKKGESGNQESQSHGTKQHPKTKPENKEMSFMEANDSLNLPAGWTLEWKVRHSGARKGTKYKCITDPSTGSKFYSMPEVYRYLRSIKDSDGSSKQAKEESISNSENNPTPSSNIEKTSNGRKRKHFIDEVSPTQSTLVSLVAAGNNEAQSKRITRSSSKVQSVSTGLEPILSVPGPAKTVYEMVPAKPNGEVSAVGVQSKKITRSSSKVQSATTCEPSLELIPLSPEPAMAPQETLPAKPDGAHSKKRTRSSAKVHSASTCEPSTEQILLLPEPANTPQETVPVKRNGEVSSAGSQSKRRTRSSAKIQTASTCEPSSEQILLLPEPAKTPQETVPVKPNGEVSAVEDQSKRSTRSSSKVKSSPTCEPNLEQMPLLPEPAKTAQDLVPEPAKTAQDLVPAKPDDVFPFGAQSKKRTRSTKVQSAYICEPSLEQIPLLPEPAHVPQEIMPPKHDGQIPSVGVRSMRRTRSTSKVRCTYVFEPSLEQMPSLPQPAQGAQEMVIVKTDGEASSFGAQSKRRQRSSAQVQHAPEHEPNLEQTWLLPEPAKEALETSPAKPNGAVYGVEAIGDVRQKVHAVNRKQINVVPKAAHVRKSRINKSTIKDRKMSNLSSCSSKRLGEVEAEASSYSIPIEHVHLSTESSGKTNTIPSMELVPNESQQRAETLDDRQNVLTPQQETYWTFDVNTPTELQTQVESMEKINYFSQEYIEEIFLQEAAGPPGFSDYPRAKITQSTIDQLFEDSVDTMPEDMIEKSPEEHKTLEEHKVPEEHHDTLYRPKIDKSSENCPVLEEPTTLGRNNVQPGSQFCFSSLWSDPCLEFAFKTLTGALPLDDNVAIQDYMEHQFRTCEQVNNQQTPDIGMSSFCQNDDANLTPQFPDDAGFMKSNGFNSYKPSR